MYSVCPRSVLRGPLCMGFRGWCSEPAPQNTEHRRKANRLRPLPPEFLKAVEKTLGDQNADQLKSGGELLHRQLWSRHEPVESLEIQERANRLQQEMFGTKLSKLDDEERTLVEPQIREVIINKLRKQTYHWMPVSYDDFGSRCYLIGRFPYEYAALHNIFSEIRISDPLFQPSSCLDFGSGVGTVWWILKEFYASSFHEYFSVDIQRPMRELARQLAAGGDLHGPIKTGIYAQRAKLPSSVTTTYDVAVSAFSLMELANQRERLSTIETLWNKTNRLLVIVENGNMSGFKLVSEARKFILEMSDHAQEARSYVLAPCTHNLPCQRMLAQFSNYPCSFPCKYPIIGTHRVGRASYSYVVLSKVRPKSVPQARVIENVIAKTRHVICRLCTSKGRVEEKVFTKGKHEKTVYAAARNAEWGDLFVHEDVPSAASQGGKTKEGKPT